MTGNVKAKHDYSSLDVEVLREELSRMTKDQLIELALKEKIKLEKAKIRRKVNYEASKING